MNSGYILINKEKGVTTTNVDNYIKRIFNIKKVGHLGTLDPFASGLLIIGINEATKFFPLIEEDEKEYIASIKLGIETDTLDLTGNIINSIKPNKYTIEEINEVLNSFLGVSKQIPPKYSAVHIDGKRAYDLARDNIEFEIKERDIDIKEISLIKYIKEEDIIIFKCKVSKGTYIRTLGFDIAKKLNTTGHLISLERTSIGSYLINNSYKKEDISNDSIIPIYKFLNIDLFEINNESFKKVNNGNEIKILSDKKYLFLTHDKRLIALYTKSDNIYKCVRRLNIYESL